ncbi:MAG: FecR family protein [Desulfobacterales bacterium]|nr:FecR family protein [Desulfobacterales bacterium]
MRGLKRFIYSVIGVTIFVILPGFFIVSIHMENSLPGKIYWVTDVSGRAFVQYQTSHPVTADRGAPAQYQKKSQWIPLQRGSKINSGALVKVDDFAYVDIMKSKEAALRLNGNTLVRLDLIPTPKRVDATLDYGKILCRISGNGAKGNGQKAETFRVITPVATAHVRGTSFSVDYLKEGNITNVSVLEGLVAVESGSIPQMEFPVSKGQHLHISPSRKVPVLADLTPDLREELQAAQNLQIKLSLSERWEDIRDLAMNSPLFHKGVAEITRYEMKVFLRAIRYFAPLRWQNDVPKSLKSVELEDGDYIDPWGTEYFYEKTGAGCAMIISAGPDKILHTTDDIFMNISLRH